MRSQSWLFGTIIWVIAAKLRGRYGCHLLSCQVSWIMSVEVARFGMRRSWLHAPYTWCLQLPCVADLGGWCKIGDLCCLLAPAHQPFSCNSLDLSAPEETYSRNVRASGTLKFGYEGVFSVSYFILHVFIFTLCFSDSYFTNVLCLYIMFIYMLFKRGPHGRFSFAMFILLFS